MHRSMLRWVPAAWRGDPPATIAEDAAVADLLRSVEEVRRRWRKRFDEAAPRLADYFARDVDDRTSEQLKRILRGGGFSVKFRMTRPMRDAIDATIAQQVGLIRSIPEEYLGKVEGAVMRSVQAGRDLGSLVDEIRDIYSVTRKRAALIARDQNNKATGTMVRARQLGLGLEDAVWMHSHAGKEPRPTHVKMDGKRFKIADGMYDSAEGRNVHPGELINCRCTSRPIIPGLHA